MIDRLVRWLLAAVVAVVVFLAYSIHSMSKQLDDLQWRLSTSSSGSSPLSVVQSLDAPLHQIQANQISSNSSDRYAELLLEGLVRKAGLPLETARRAFEAQGKASPGWHWNPPWEPAEAPPSAPAK